MNSRLTETEQVEQSLRDREEESKGIATRENLYVDAMRRIEDAHILRNLKTTPRMSYSLT